MSNLKLKITISLDGYVAGPDQSTEHPLGIGGERLHEWLYRVLTRAYRRDRVRRGLGIRSSASRPNLDAVSIAGLSPVAPAFDGARFALPARRGRL